MERSTTSGGAQRFRRCSVFVRLALACAISTAVTAHRAVGLDLELVPFASGFTAPLGLVGTADGRLFVVEQAGIIKIISAGGAVLPTPFLDITDRVDSSSNEEGLLGLAFHPDHATNGFFYVNYVHTTGTRRSRISRFEVTADPNVADPLSEQILLTIDQPNSNHNAGHILFGPDGLLYVPMGDGGGAGDTGNNAQNPALLLGKVSRIDVDAGPGAAPDCKGLGTGNYTVPDTNPLKDGPGGACDEIWALGLRNPWRSSFDRLTGDLLLGDVGQGSWEEIDFQPASSIGGENYGWRCYEGNHSFNTAGCGPIGSYVFPIFEFSHTLGCSVTGGYVYRGSTFPAMVGHYFLTDYCSGNFWDLVPNGVGGWTPTLHTNLRQFGLAAFGEASDGELYVANVETGDVLHLVDEGPQPTSTPTLTATLTSTPTPTPDLSTCPCPGDAARDGFINFADFGAVQQNFGAPADPETGIGDADCNGFVNFTDFGVVQATFGTPCP